MSLDIAYSSDMDLVIDAEQAYEYFLLGRIKDKRAFRCPSENCRAQITCCNIDKDFHDMRQHQHFRVYGIHSPECEINNKTFLIPSYTQKKEKLQRSKINENYVDEFVIYRPQNYYDGKTLLYVRKIKYPLLKYKPLTIKIGNAAPLSTSRVYSVRSVINRYKRYKDKNMLDYKKIRIDGALTPYSSLFLKIDEQNLKETPNRPRFYCGLAYIKPTPETEEDGCVIDFIHKLKDEDKIYPTQAILYISDILKHNNVYNNKIGNLLLKSLDVFLQNQNPAYVFLYSTPIKENSSTTQRIKFSMSNPDMLYICDASFMF